MALVPHRITALAESDAQGTDGKNIVAGAVVSLYDTNGTAVTLFDDAAGTNGSTAKTTDATGQVVVWITAGEYDEEVNGSVKRRVNVGGNSVVSYEDTESLQASRPNKTGQRAENRARANAQYVLAPEGYTALPGDVVAANGRVWELQIDGSMNVLWSGFHPSKDAITNWPLFQDAIDRVALNGGGEVFIPYQGAEHDGYYYGKAPRIVEPNITVRCESPDTTLICTGNPSDGTGNWPNYGSVVLGTILQPQNVPYFDIQDISQGDVDITLSAASESSSFLEGDVIFICSILEYNEATPRRTYGQMNVVTQSSSGVLGLRYPIQRSVSGCQVQNYTQNTYEWKLTNGANPDTKTEYSRAPRDCKILGGTWITEKAEAPFNGGSGMIDCVIDVHRVEARSGVAYGNQFGHCEFKALTQITRKSGIELAYSSHNNKIEILSDINKAQDGTAYATIGAIWCNEGSRDNTINVGTLDCGVVPHGSVIALTNSSGNVVSVSKILTSAVTNAIVRFRDSVIATNRANTHDNVVKVGSSRNANPIVDYVEFTNNGKLANNKISSGSFYGDTLNAVKFDGITSNETVEGCSFENGKPVILNFAGVLPSVKCSFFSEGLYNELATISDHNRVLSSGVTSDLKRLLSRTDTDMIGGAATSASPFVLSGTIPAGALQFGDTVNFFMSVFISGSSSSDDKSFEFTVGGVSDSTFITNASGSEVIIRGQLYKASNTAVVMSYTIFEGDATVSTRCQNVSVANISSNNTVLEITATPSNASDSLSVRHANVSTYCRNAGR